MSARGEAIPAPVEAGAANAAQLALVTADILPFPEAPADPAYEGLLVGIHGKSATLVAKRVLDILVAIVALIVLAVPLLFVALLVRLTSAGPAIFRQKRAGLRGKVFTIYKFRSMYVAEQDLSGIKHTVKDDPRVTPLGLILRKYSLDELPQLVNVLKGDMSIVGPRAHAIGMKALGVPYHVLVRDYSLRHLVRPGITGLAQIRGFRGEVDTEAHARGRIANDLDYVRGLSIWSDVKIMVLTIPAVISGRAAY